MSYYTGITNDLDKRLLQHNNGFDKRSYTYSRRPLKLMYFIHFNDVMQAIAWEKRIKGWNRKKKEALIREDLDRLVELSKSKNKNDAHAIPFDKLRVTCAGKINTKKGNKINSGTETKFLFLLLLANKKPNQPCLLLSPNPNPITATWSR
jgi:putative endonuclease